MAQSTPTPHAHDWDTINRLLREPFANVKKNPQGFSYLDWRDIQDRLDEVVGAGHWFVAVQETPIDPLPQVQAIAAMKAAGVFAKEGQDAARKEESHYRNLLREVPSVLVRATLTLAPEGLPAVSHQGVAAGCVFEGEDAPKMAATRAGKLAAVPFGIGRSLYQEEHTGGARSHEQSALPLWRIVSQLCGDPRKSEDAKRRGYKLKDHLAKLAGLNPRDRDVLDQLDASDQPIPMWVNRKVRETAAKGDLTDGDTLDNFCKWLSEKVALATQPPKIDQATGEVDVPPIQNGKRLGWDDESESGPMPSTDDLDRMEVIAESLDRGYSE